MSTLTTIINPASSGESARCHARIGLMRTRRTNSMQKSSSDLEYAAQRKATKRERLLGELEAITLWAELLTALAPHYPKDEGRGRPPI